MKQIDVILQGVTHAFANGDDYRDQLFVTMAVSSCVINSENGAKWNFPIPPLVTVCIEPYRMVIPLNDKYALTQNGSEVEFRVTGTVDDLKVKLLKVVERKDRSLKSFIEALPLNKR